MNAPASSDVAAQIVAQRHAFKSFLARRLGNAADAEDLLQHSLVKALRHAGDIQHSERAVAWFYQLLRHAVVDHVRSRAATREREHAWATEAALLDTPDRADADTEREICRCFERLVPTLKPAQAELLRRVELHDEPVAAVAADLGITPNNASVTLHRARAELRRKLEHFCGPCAETACLNCDCPEPAP